MAIDSETLRTLRDRAESNRHRWESHWRDVAEVFMPTRHFLTKELPGGRRRQRQYDPTGAQSGTRLANAMLGITANPGQRWITLLYRDEPLNERKAAAEWRDEVTRRMYRALSRQNFYTHAHEVFTDQVFFGTGSMMRIDTPEGMTTISRPLEEMHLIDDHFGMVWGVMRKFFMSPVEMAQRFGRERLSDRARDAIDQPGNQKHERVCVLHFIVPRSALHGTDGIDAADKPIGSVYQESESGSVLSEGGFEQMPVLSPRWSVTPGEVYGRSPAMEILGQQNVVNELSKQNLIGWQKAISPPLLIETGSVSGDIRMTPNSISNLKPGRNPPQPMNTGDRPDLGENFLAAERARIEQSFFRDILEIPVQTGMTATEINARMQQKMVELASVSARQESEWLRPYVEGLFRSMMAAGELPDPPAEIRGAQLDLEFTSVLAQAQRRAEANNVFEHIQFMSPFAQVDPSIFDIYDPDEVGRFTAERMGVAQKTLRDPGVVREIRESRQQQQAAAQQAETAKTAAEAAASGSQAFERIGQLQQ